MKARFKHLFFNIYHFCIRLDQDNVSAFSAKASYFLILSMFPFIMLLLTLIRYTPITEPDLIMFVTKIMPNAIDPLVTTIIQEMYDKANGAVISVTAVLAIWSAAKGVLAIKTGLNKIYRIKEERNYFLLRIICSFYTIIFLIMIIFTLSLLVFGNTLYKSINNYSPFLHGILSIFINMRFFLALMILTLFFIFLYKIVPNKHLSLFSVLPGSLFSALGWMLFSSAYSYYIDNFASFSYIYGSLTTVVLLMLWAYACMYIMFVGATLNVHFNKYFEQLLSYIRLKRSFKKSQNDLKKLSQKNS